ncbi:cytochrome b/b6 domain-containing protein [Phenylobacterium sp.]|uniref:cytochrome b/b6 domain-containing protein n=1 Tax=Phenylobacterium sp. TaxID=1871053 RepID=UPI002FDFD144
MSDKAQAPRAVGSARYATVAIVLHWTIAALIVLQVVLAGRMDAPPSPERFEVTQLHKSVGITVLLLSLFRLAWRLMHPPAPLPDTLGRPEKALAGVTHVLLYAVMIGLPLTGWVMVSASRFGLPTILYGLVPWPNVLGLAGLEPAAKEAWHGTAEFAHKALAKATYVLVGLHVAGALKHQLFSRDEPVLARMAPGARAGRWLEPRILIILAAFLAVAAFGRVLDPPHPGMSPPTKSGPAADPLEAQGPRGSASTEGPAAAGLARWRVAPGSEIRFTTSWGGRPIEGRFIRWRAGLLYGPDDLERSGVTAVIDLSSAVTGDAQRDQVLPSPDWLDVARHPEAVFRATGFEPLGGNRYVARGTLELRGVVRPLDLPFTLDVEGDKAEAHGVTTLDRTAFGVGQGEWAETDQIPAAVTVSVDLKATRG